MLGLLLLALLIALCITVMPALLGGLAVMLRFLFTLVLWSASGCPDPNADTRDKHESHAVPDLAERQREAREGYDAE